MENFITSPVALLAMSFLLLLIFLIFFITLIVKFFNRYPSETTTNYHSRFIAIGLTAAVFNNTFSFVVMEPITRLTNSITYLINYISYTKKLDSSQIPDDLDISFVGQSISGYAHGFPLGNFFLGIGVAIILFRLVNYLFSQTNNSAGPANHASNSNAFGYNILVLSILSFSLFLVISVFISIPYLNEIKKPSFFTRNSLDTALNAIRLSDTSLVKKDLAASTPFQVISLKDTVLNDLETQAHYARLPENVRKNLDQTMSAVDRSAKDFNTQRSDAISRINNSVVQYTREKPLNRDKLIQNYERFAQSNAVDKDLLFTTSINVYRSYIQIFRNELDQAYHYFTQSDIDNTIEYSDLISKAKNSINSFFGSNDSLDLNHSITNFQPQFINYDAEFLTTSLIFDGSVSVSKRDGSDWGLFGLIARFLIKTESLELVLLIGMLGFGLLGASLSSFQGITGAVAGENPAAFESILDTFKSVPIIKNFWSVLARGFSAAILIYLATKGGIAVLTGNLSADPNGYILLLMCFVGAVFSEKVWTAAKNKYGL